MTFSLIYTKKIKQQEAVKEKKQNALFFTFSMRRGGQTGPHAVCEIL